MRRLIAALCLAVAACSPKAGLEDGAFRNPSAPIYSNAGFDVSRLQGQWHQVAGFSNATPQTCKSGEATFLARYGALSANVDLCLSGKSMAGKGQVAPTGPGRFTIDGPGGIGQVWWVLWVDEGYRTLAIGNPSGAFGFILNRGKTLPADRLAAAREVLDFNGYDIENLVVFGK